LAIMARLRQAAGDQPGADEAIAEAESFSYGPPGLLNPVPAEHAQLLLARGDVTQAARWAADSGLVPGDLSGYPREHGYLVLARVLRAQGRPDQALALLDRLEAAAAAQHRTGSLIEIHALRAVTFAALGDDAGALAALACALRLGCPQGYVRVFADEGPELAAVLARVQRAFGAGHAPGGGAATDPRTAAGLIEQLTGRELEVLAMLAAGRSNQNIARSLVISLDTVKKHVSHLLAKLGAANRTEAVARGRDLRLID
jgi:LuxR family maltose regulon positive regulatory protein